uniref:Tryptophan synthase beta chain-like PALP domain-containing protein n=1 Tax=Lotharella globosa TaxID=91324 RepID=A0A7S4DLW3_9EUKA|mmetsp:Transcript_13073/g.24769  ORF Transcript_13073/g.24769 Transcript_13073/m.24769 type:complete len:384 (+) Transcript_13073:66-1217(+)
MRAGRAMWTGASGARAGRSAARVVAPMGKELKTAVLPETKKMETLPQIDQNPYPRFRTLIGDTPLVDVTALGNPKNAETRVLAKCEFVNPGYSVKDRIVLRILEEAEMSGELRKGMTIVAASSGNTGASTAMIASMKGYKSIIITSPKCSQEKQDAIRAYGAELLVTRGGLKPDDPEHYMNMETTLVDENPHDYFGVNQYENQLNPLAHYLTLGPEIWRQTDGSVTHFVAAGSTGGTLSGTSKYLKEKSNGRVRSIMADPIGSVFYAYFKTGVLLEPGKFEVEGVGKENIPGTMNFDVVDDAIRVTDAQAFQTCHDMASKEGIMAGGSGGLNVFAATELASRLDEAATIVTVIPDSGIKYLSKIYNKDYCESLGIEIKDPVHY